MFGADEGAVVCPVHVVMLIHLRLISFAVLAFVLGRSLFLDVTVWRVPCERAPRRRRDT